jgi:RNA polymerase sigma-70 factor (ECF subfamily)
MAGLILSPWSTLQIVREPASTLASRRIASVLAKISVLRLSDVRRTTCQDVHLRTFDQTPEALLARVATGDQDAFASLYDQLAGTVYGITLKVLRDPAQAEEVAQEVFVEIWRQANRYQPGRASVRTWAATIAHRRAVDRVRSEQSSRERIERVGRQSEETADAADTVLERLDQDRAAEALTSLTEAQREVITLAYYGGLTHTQIAERLQVPLGTVKTRARDGLIKLRERMGRNGE